MYLIGVNFSARENGNCKKVLQFCLDLVSPSKETALFYIHDYDISSCGGCEYECTHHKQCPIKDEFIEVFQLLIEAEAIIFCLPTYSSHLPSTYFTLMERFQPYFHEEESYQQFLKKLNFILLGNPGHGGNMAKEELIAGFKEQGVEPKVFVIASTEYGMNAIRDNLIDREEVCQGLCELMQDKV